MPRIIVERSFEPPIGQDDVNATLQRVGECLDLHNVRYIRSRLSADRRRMFCEFEAADAQSVRDVQNAARVPFDRVWAADIIGES